MAKEKEKPKEEKGGEGKKRKHLHEIRTTQAEDGSLVHHHSYAESKGAPPEPERGPMATSQSPDEAGQHVAEQFAMNQGARAGPPGGGGEPPEAGGGAPEPGGGEGGPPEAA
jgi:hypothetical protein